jgi:hypothetical protein
MRGSTLRSTQVGGSNATPRPAWTMPTAAEWWAASHAGTARKQALMESCISGYSSPDARAREVYTIQKG